ncbi:peptidoglycan DD-metalloendopeptidase family protein [Jannaschia sp. Os4]|uniref:murein hydrolase activator EnvC family protein n=1 Tax=Jannaschia sp. Os4 TaxID=2807617 RepID=UPI00193AC07B|nr:peptidoglycan DD-metalloendopeptidase family protein [Jannaschia sp. Os4]MBM2575173.1 peptidoglycan DD-metalloendopeptidase family protein [Jannaschia sp. Os4]
MPLRLIAVLLALALPASGPARAQDAAETAREAARDLQDAAVALQRAEGASDRIAALTDAVRAHERGLSALRDGLRRLAIRERALTADLSARREDVARLLGVLGTMRKDPAPLLLLHPSGPLGTARSAMAIREVTPALQARAEALRGDLARLAELRALQEGAADTMTEGLSSLEAARTALSEAVKTRAAPPAALSADPAALAALLGRADTLAAFADGLVDLGGPLPDLASAAAPPWPLPVEGVRLRGYREADAAGVRRDGWVVATPPAALLVAPAPATVRHAGPLLDYGNVIILETAPGSLLVFAGLSEVYAATGAILPTGAPLAIMGGGSPTATDFLRDAREGGGGSASETLYIEVRQGGRPVDPADWFAI